MKMYKEGGRMTSIYAWVQSTDAMHLPEISSSDGKYNVDVYYGASTARYVVQVYNVREQYSTWYTASTLAGARAVGRAGQAPGTAPGRYRYVKNPNRLKEVQS